MKPFSNTVRGAGVGVTLSALVMLAGCHGNPAEPNAANFTKTINTYLADRGHLCVAKYDWPIHVADQDAVLTHSRDAVQLPVMEKLGLVKSNAMMVERTGEDGIKIRAPGREYALTDAGQKFYVHKTMVVAMPGKTVTHDADFCVATLTLDKVVGWEPPQTHDGQTRTSVLFTYKIDPAPFARDPQFQRVFPMVARVIEGAGTMQLREGVRLTKDGWVAEEYFVR
ncbi:hypothetical protein [Paraburkholderia adhaesiva]|uniref:hypothetical protein n=1 Tax=Paraburkholderia adhaesiva TaxID=2883244 RepID=UPI001F25F6DE|nr:hypothetical protein [Paraburkholderia adhaesiva]